MKQEVITVVKDILDLSICSSNWYHKLNIFQRKPMLSTLPEPDLCRFPIPGLSSPILHFSGQIHALISGSSLFHRHKSCWDFFQNIFRTWPFKQSHFHLSPKKTDYLIHFVVYSSIWFSVSLPLWNISLMKES